MVSNYNSFFLGLSSNTKMQVKMSKIIVLSGGAKSKVKPIKKNGYYYFKDYPEFTPNISPEEMFRYGSFGGTYWRPIKSKFFKGELKNKHLKYPKSWWDKIPDNHMTLPFNKYDETVNKYGVKVGSTLENESVVPTNPNKYSCFKNSSGDWYCTFDAFKKNYFAHRIGVQPEKIINIDFDHWITKYLGKKYYLRYQLGSWPIMRDGLPPYSSDWKSSIDDGSCHRINRSLDHIWEKNNL